MAASGDVARLWVLFPSRGGPSVERVAEILARRGLTTAREGEAFVLRGKAGPPLRLLRGPADAAAQALAQTTTELSESERTDVADSDACLEVRLDDLDAALSERATLYEVQSTLQDLTGGFVFTHWNSVLQVPEKTQAG